MNHSTYMIWGKTIISKISTLETYELRPGNKSKW